jgi:hypothetical protein
MTIAGWVLAGLVGALLVFSATMKFINPPELVEEFVGKFGYPESAAAYIGATEAVCLVLFLIPRTCVLGAVLLTGYFGGAVATHVRVEDNFAGAVVAGAVVWLALFLREPRVRALLPLVQPPSRA